MPYAPKKPSAAASAELRAILAASVACLSLSLSACRSSAPTQQTLTVSGASNAVILLQTQLRTSAVFNRPSALLGVFVADFLAGGTDIPVTAAVTGVETALKLMTAAAHLDPTDIYGLLEEYGGVLSVNIPDILNRSTDRASTLNEYQTGLQNITARAQMRRTALQGEQDRLNGQVRTNQDAYSALDRQRSKALRDQDYATAGSLQQQISDAQAQLSKTQSDLRQTTDTLRIYDQLIALAQKRLDAIDKNREVLIAGLKVVDVPGIESLGVLQGGTNRSGGGLLGF